MAGELEEEISEHLFLVGSICSMWAHLEFLTELTMWWLIGFLQQRTEGRVITAGLSLEIMAKRVCDLCHLKISNAEDRIELEKIRDRIIAAVDERNLAVHGVRQLNPDTGETHAELTRGKYKNVPQRLSSIRLNSLIDELASIVGMLEPLLIRYQVLERPADLPSRPQSLQQRHPHS